MFSARNCIFVVEGHHDQALLSSLVDTEIVVVNGLEISNSEINYLNAAKKFKTIIILTDPDDVGRNISNKILKLIPEAKDVCLDIQHCNKHNKHGVAECSKEHLLNKIEPHIEKYIGNEEKLFDKNLIISLNSKEIKNKICREFCLGNCNNKTMIKRLRTLHITQEQIEKIIYGN